ncbi:MAG TPA: oxidoreductase [Chloroflexi bacterium]|nr:oxidoreductase [Chloroflexota bacterium]HAL25271.1 oxidoreductase [Chloroflexota bacterium]
MGEFDFPLWLRATHFLNLLFLTFLARSGIEILASFPRFYRDDHCVPGSELLKLTRRKVSPSDYTTALEEELEAPGWLALPGGAQLGAGRHWHLFVLLFWILTGLTYVVLLFVTDEWQRLVPTSWSIVPTAISNALSYLHGQLPPALSDRPYNALQQITYFAVVFLLAPFQIATGAAMSSAVMARFPWYPSAFGGRQRARFLHFLGLLAFAAFVAAHTAMVVVHGLALEWSKIVIGEDANRNLALVVGVSGLVVVVILNILATIVTGRSPRFAQHSLGVVADRLQALLSYGLSSHQRYRTSEISPYMWLNGYPPPDPAYRRLAEGAFADWRLAVNGLVEHELSLGIEDLKAIGQRSQITKHNCIQGWSSVAEWTGVDLAAFVDYCRPLAGARYAVFYAFDDKGETDPRHGTGRFYEVVDLRLARMPQNMLAWGMNGKPLTIEHGAPLRLRLENQLGFKMVKWIRAVEFVDEYAHVGLGQGGWREDHQYYSRVVGI